MYMSEFDAYGDGAFQLKKEGESIRLEFKKGVPANGQGTVEWNIPVPADGCEAGTAGAYAGLVILISNSPMTSAEIPQDGKVYIADPTADINLHVGDKIGNALVVGAIYECEAKNRGEELTTSLIVSNLDTDKAYYVAAYITDCQFRYHSDGTRAYSDSYGNGDEPDTPGHQHVSFGLNKVLPTDGTDLVPGVNYAFDIVVDRAAPTGRDFDVVEINIDGLDAGTYDDLIGLINDQIKQVNNPPMSPIPPNSGTFFYDPVGQKLFQFDGYVYNEVPAIIEALDPVNVNDGDYWYDTDNEQLFLRVAGSWQPVSTITNATDPRLPTCEDFWFNGTDGKSWNGTTWCETTTTASATDPSLCVDPECGTIWYDTTDRVLYNRNTENLTWEITSAISWDDDPQALPDGTYWFDLDTNALNQMTTGAWVDISSNLGVYIQEAAPVSPADGDVWYVPSTEILSTYVLATTSWDVTPVLVWPGDPTDTGSCDLWWRTTDDVMFTWDSTNLQWDQVTAFIQSTIDPAASPVIELDSLWYDSVNGILNKWDGSGWEAVSAIHHPTDPTLSINGEVWFDTTNTLFYVWNAGSWMAIDPKESANDPTLLPNGTYWFNTTTDALFVRNGHIWVPVTYTTVPLIPARGDNWYDSSTGALYEWDGTTYVEVNGVAKASINSRGQIVIQNTATGSGTIIFIPVPSGANVAGVGCAKVGTGHGDFNNEGVTPGSTCAYNSLSGEVSYPVRDIPVTGFLWDHITPAAAVQQPQEGQDGKTGAPAYDTLGVGDDGTPDERRELADSLRAQLGHPVVTVELSKYQIDTAIQGALESFRKRSSMAYKRGFFFMDAKPQQSNYTLTNKRIGYNKIVTVTAIQRFTSAFLSTAGGAGVYGQVVLQHLYNMGTYDLTSFHLISQYVEQLEHLFATRIVFNWDEDERRLDIFQSFTRPERLLLDCVVERTEQNLLKDRYAKSWIERYALSECQLMLAQIRGKFGSLPGAGGGIALNASELTALAQDNRAELMQQIDDYVVSDVENLGMHTTFIIG